jgi:transposase
MGTKSGQDMDMRELKALEIAARSRIVFDDGAWLVPSQTSTTTKYRVHLLPTGPTCTCDDWQLRQEPCKHILAVRICRERDGSGPAVAIKTDAVPKRPTYPQNWVAYNLAQREERHRFCVLLADLCAGIPEPVKQETRGRKPVPMADRLFSIVYKVYGAMSSRRSGCDLDDAADEGHLSRTLHPNKVNIFLEMPELTPLLHGLICRSALPLKAVETIFAPDSSGFSVSKFVRWFDEKYGKERSGHDWVKVHLICGVNTGIVTAAALYDRDTNDSPILPELVQKTAEKFTVDEVLADKGYLSAENVDAIHAVGGTPFIAPKSNTTGGIGGLFEKMFHYYQYRREEFLQHYHQRSNVESVFSAIKRKFGDNIRSRSDAAKVNEALCKIVCHNLCRVILSQCELGIEAEFWDNDRKGEEEGPAILPMVRPG